MVVLIVLAVLAAAALAVWLANARIRRKRPRAGDAAPSFSLADQNGRTRSLAEFRGHWLVLYFYPRDDTPGCTKQATRYRNAMRDFQTLGAQVCAVSIDGSDSHAAFARKFELTFPLLSDPNGDVARQYGSLRHLGVLRFARRNTFLIDPEGRVARVYVRVNAERDAEDVIADLAALAPRVAKGSTAHAEAPFALR